MTKDEVNLGNSDEDYEVVPVGPIRKLERRLDGIEKKAQQSGGMGGADDELVRDVLDIMKSNQKIVNEMTQSTHELKNSVEDLTHKMDDVVDNMNSFMDLLSEASEADLEGEVINDVHGRIADAIGDRMEDVARDMKESNEEVVENLQQLNKSVKRSYTSENKDQILSGNNNRSGTSSQRPQQSQRQSNNQSRRQRQQPDAGGRQTGGLQNQSRDLGRSNDKSGNDFENSERMRKLRKKFEKTSNDQ